MSKRIYIISGEASGDLHGANVMKQLYHEQPDLDIRYWGGDKMKAVGGTLAKHIKELAFMGFVEVLMNIRTILRNMKFCKEDILAFKPDALLLIDYPGFNLRIAKWAKENNIKVYYYISPTVWAWKENRVENIRRDVFKLFTILPFEKAFYAKHEIDVEYVGHPLLDEIRNYQNTEQTPLDIESTDKAIVALLPGSRVQELKTKLPVMLALVDKYPQYHFVIAGAPNMDEAIYKEMIGSKSVSVVFGQTYTLLKASSLAVVTSGTATLETALFGVPQVVCYKGNPISYAIAKRLVKVKYISLPNLILDEPLITELIQGDCTIENVQREFELLQPGQQKRAQIEAGYRKISELLSQHDRDENGDMKGASAKVAQYLLKTI
jgi:lipid-A-disaccharide synthase